MNLSTANTIAGGIILGVALLLISLIIFAVRKILNKKGKIHNGKGLGKPTLITGALGILVCVISLVTMLFSGNTGNVGTIFSVMRSSEQAIYNDKLYVKTDFYYNGGKDKYNTEKAKAVLSGAGELYTLKNFEKYEILVEMNSNITGVIFVSEKDREEFENYYGDYKINYNSGAVLDKQDKKMTTIDKKADSSLYAQLADKSNYSETSEKNVGYRDKISETRCCVFWATSKDNLVTSQITVYPKDKNGKYIITRDEKYYELKQQLTSKIDEYF